MILTREAIMKRMATDAIRIEPFEERFLNPNGYDLHLGDTLLVPDTFNSAEGGIHHTLNPFIWDVAKEIKYETFPIDPEKGIDLYPGILYLGSTMEFTDAKDTVPIMEGKSSVGRMGIDVHICAGFGDIGFAGYWTLEIRVMYPTRIYAGMPIGQLVWHTVEGEVNSDYSQVGNYANQHSMPTPTKYWKNFESKLLK